jgi:oligoendopeptidase F
MFRPFMRDSNKEDTVATTFEQYIYKRPNLAKEKEQFTHLLNALIEASTIYEANKAIQAINQFRNRLSTLFNLVFIRSSIDTNDEFYQNERDFFDHAEPEIKELDVTFYKELIQSPFRKELEQQWGSQLFHIAECSVRTFSPEIIPLLQTENKLTSSYAKLVASAEVEFQGKTYTLAQLGPFTEDKNRNIRKKAVQVRADFFAETKHNLMRSMTSSSTLDIKSQRSLDFVILPKLVIFVCNALITILKW